MANNTITARVQLRYDTYSRWMASDVILLAGEIAVAAFPYSHSITNTDVTPENTPPAIGIKVGDGVHYFSELPWLQAVAADVYSWAKSENKPTYSATEISGLADYIQQHTGGGSGGGGTASTAYQIIYDSNTNKYILQYYDDATNEWVNTSSEINLNSIITRLNNIERWANGARTNLGNIELPMVEYIYEAVLDFFNTLDYNDEAVEHQFVTQVTQTDGQIAVLRRALSAEDITAGTLPTERGGTGITFVDEDELLVGSLEGNLTKKKFVTEIVNQRNAFATVGAIKDYVLDQTAGLTGAMHFIGESTIVIINGSNVNPQIIGYDFANVQPGDVILANNAQEFVWTGTNWRLLGDEGSYAVKGSIVNADIAEEANIAQSKISGLSDTLDTKVDKVEGKSLTSNDFSNEYKQKLDDIESEAQVNVIEHVFLNHEEVQPSVVSGLAKSIDLQFTGMTPEQGDKLEHIEANAQVNVIEHIKLNNTEVPPDNTKTVNIDITEYTNKLDTIEEGAQINRINSITMDGEPQTPDADGNITLISNPHTEHINVIEHIFVNGTELLPATINNETKSVNVVIDEAALQFQILKGARYPNGNSYTDIDIDTTSKKLELSHLAATGDIQHLLQTNNTYIILDCGTSDSDIHPPITE